MGCLRYGRTHGLFSGRVAHWRGSLKGWFQSATHQVILYGRFWVTAKGER